MAAARSVFTGEAEHAVNIAGGLHHAMPDRSSGFCVYNDLSVAIQWLLDQGVERVAYIDVDVHHGDGVQAAFWDDPRVLTVSIHESPATLFPGTGATEIGGPKALGTAVNIAVPAGTGDQGWLRAFHAITPHVLGAFRPQIVVSQHGADSHFEDPLASLAVSIDGQRMAAEAIHRWAHKYAAGKWVATGGGGYEWVDVVPRSWTNVVAIATEQDPAPDTAIPEGWSAYVRGALMGRPGPSRMTDGYEPWPKNWDLGYNPPTRSTRRSWPRARPSSLSGLDRRQFRRFRAMDRGTLGIRATIVTRPTDARIGARSPGGYPCADSETDYQGLCGLRRQEAPQADGQEEAPQAAQAHPGPAPQQSSRSATSSTRRLTWVRSSPSPGLPLPGRPDGASAHRRSQHRSGHRRRCRAPRDDIGRAEFVRADIRNPIIAKVINAAEVDTVVHMGVIATPIQAGGRMSMKEINVIGTMQLLAACQKSPSVRRLVVKSTTSVYGAGPRDPAMFSEEIEPRTPRRRVGQRPVEVEAYVRGFARRRPDVTVTTLRFANFIGPRVQTPMTSYFSLPAVPVVMGDARLQFIHEDDGLRAIHEAAVVDKPGLFNVAGDGIIPLSQAIRLAGRLPFPLLPPLVRCRGSGHDQHRAGGLLAGTGAVPDLRPGVDTHPHARRARIRANTPRTRRSTRSSRPAA